MPLYITISIYNVELKLFQKLNLHIYNTYYIYIFIYFTRQQDFSLAVFIMLTYFERKHKTTYK